MGPISNAGYHLRSAWTSVSMATQPAASAVTRPLGRFFSVILAAVWWLVRAFVGVMIRIFQVVVWLFGFGWTNRN